MGKKKITLWKIDDQNTNPYKSFIDNGWDSDLTEEQIAFLKDEATLEPSITTIEDTEELNWEIELTQSGIAMLKIEDM